MREIIHVQAGMYISTCKLVETRLAPERDQSFDGNSRTLEISGLELTSSSFCLQASAVTRFVGNNYRVPLPLFLTCKEREKERAASSCACMHVLNTSYLFRSVKSSGKPSAKNTASMVPAHTLATMTYNSKELMQVVFERNLVGKLSSKIFRPLFLTVGLLQRRFYWQICASVSKV